MQKPKLFLLFLCIINSTISFSQKSFDIDVHHDTKFIFSGDERGNNTGTTDIIIKFEVPFKRFPKSYLTVFPSFEYANLNTGSLKRYAVGVGYFYTDVFFKRLNMGVLPNYGFIKRFNNTTGSFGVDIEISYRIAKRVSLSYVHQIIERTDLKVTYNETKYIKPSSFMGFKVHF